MNFRYFIYVSVAIHVLGGLVLFFHYKPFHSESPQPVEKVEPPLPSAKDPLSDSYKKEVPVQKKKFSTKTPMAKKIKTSQKKFPKKKKAQKTPLQQKLPPPLPPANTSKKEEALAGHSNLESSKKPEKPALKVKPPSPKENKESALEGSPSLKKPKTLVSKNKEEVKKDSLNSQKKEASSILFKPFSKMKLKKGNPPLTYPVSARRKGMEGLVSIIYFVTKQGLVEKIQLQNSSGHSELDNFVLRTLSRYQFEPHQASWVRHQVKFVLEGEEEEKLNLRSR